MEHPRFACPVCSVPLKSSAADRVHCPRCGAGYPRSQIDNLAMTLGKIVRQEGESADSLKERAIAELAKARLPADPMSPWNQRLRSPSIRLVGTAGDKTGPAILVLVASAWTKPLALAVFNDLLKLTRFMEDAKVDSRFQFVGNHPLPESLHFTFGATKKGRFERMALVKTGLYDPSIVLGPTRMKKVAETAVGLIKSCFRVAFTLADKSEIKWIEDLVLKELREPFSPHKPMPKDAHRPICSLLLFASLLGPLLLLRAGGDGGWEEQSAYPFSLGLSLQADGNPTLIDPLGQLMRLYDNGSTDSLTEFADGLLSGKKRQS